MMPQLGNIPALFQGRPLQFKRAKVTTSDFEALVTVQEVVRFSGLLTVMKSQDIDRKPENERRWKWWDLLTQTKIPLDSVVLDFDGAEFRIQGDDDWSQAGFFHYSLTEQPKDLGTDGTLGG